MKRFQPLAFNHALNGFKHTLKEHPNLRFHFAAGVVVVGLGWFLGINRLDWFMLLFAIHSVIVVEMVNTSLEETCNAISLEYSPAIKIAKDVSAAAVLVTSCLSVIIGLVVFIPCFSQLAVFP